jgi:hypothetical protein
LEAVADGEETEIAYVVLAQDEGLKTVEGFYGLDVVVFDVAVG